MEKSPDLEHRELMLEELRSASENAAEASKLLFELHKKVYESPTAELSEIARRTRIAWVESQEMLKISSIALGRCVEFSEVRAELQKLATKKVA